MPPGAQTIESPYDPEARYHTKRTTRWTGYTVHLTETCDEETPHLITQVATVPATTNDVEVTAPIQADLAAHDLTPAEHLLDAGYVSAQHLLASAERAIDLVGPAPPDTSWQATARAGFDMAHVSIDWEARQVTCPQGKRSRYWGDGITEHGHPFHQVIFDKDDCAACPCRPHCTRSATRPRQLALRPRAEYTALQSARQRQRTEEFTARYKKRAGVEGTMSQGVQVCGLRRSRYRGLGRTHLQHVATGVAISLQRLDDWWTETPRATTRPSRFAALAA
jgi:transposase